MRTQKSDLSQLWKRNAVVAAIALFVSGEGGHGFDELEADLGVAAAGADHQRPPELGGHGLEGDHVLVPGGVPGGRVGTTFALSAARIQWRARAWVGTRLVVSATWIHL